MFHRVFSKLLLSCCLSLSTSAEATVVRMDFTWGGHPAEEVYVELYDSEAPVTVSNFLTYVESEGVRRYDNTFLHRSIPGFVIQGGGYSYDPELGDFGILSALHIAQDAPIVNEFSPSRSNVRGTIAMAKLGGDPDSATSEWFFNLADNSANLDSQNGGFTVFGRVLGDGMQVIDAIESLDIENLGGTFTDLPLDKVDPADPVTTSTLVVLAGVAVNPPARIYLDVTNIDFDLVSVNTASADQIITLQNIGGSPLNLGSITQLDALDTPFRIIDDQCSGQTLAVVPAVSSSCQITVQFQPTLFGTAEGNLNIPSDDAIAPESAVALSGFGAYPTPTLNVEPAIAVDFGNIGVADFTEQQVTIRNFGEGLLQLGLPTVSGSNAADVAVLDNNSCLESMLDLAEACTFSVRLNAGAGIVGDSKTAILTIPADPGGQVIQLNLSGSIIASKADLQLPEFNVIDIPFYETHASTISFGNSGLEELIFISDTGSTAFEFTGANAAEFSITETTCDRVAPQQTCSATIEITPLAAGTLTASLFVRTNDPDTPLATLDLLVTASTDGDGIPDSVEAAAPNNGDGNADGIPDIEQQNVASLLNTDGEYVTVVSDIGTKLVSVRSPEPPASDDLPVAVGAKLSFIGGFFSFSIENVPVGGAATATLYMPSKRANTYFKFDANRSFNNWYNFDYDPRTGTGASIEGNRIILHFVDGNGNGDHDGAANGVIVDPGGPALLTADGSSSGGGGCSLLKTRSQYSAIPVDLLLLLFGLATLKGMFLRRQRNH